MALEAAETPTKETRIRAEMESSIEVSVVMPCLNEADTLQECIAKAQRAFYEHDIQGEIIVADNGSTDGSPAIANCMGARLMDVNRTLLICAPFVMVGVPSVFSDI